MSRHAYANRFADFDSAKDKSGHGYRGNFRGYLYFVDDAEFNRLLKKYRLREAGLL